ncbi:hypothetical protein [Actinomadura sp. 6K520]|nr:hypothetical protein [Actinomadura sp. 6K520]
MQTGRNSHARFQLRLGCRRIERITFVLVKQDDGWRLYSEEHLGYDDV